MSDAKPRYVIHYPIQEDVGPEIPTTLELTDRIFRGDWIRAPAGACHFQFKCTTQEIDRLVRVGDWVTIHDPVSMIYDFYYIERVEYSLRTEASSGGISMVGSASGISWFQLVSRFSVVGSLAGASVGTYQSVGDLVSTMMENISLYFGSKVGEALQALWRGLAKLKLPPSLGGEYLGDAIPIVYDTETAQAFAPELEEVVDPVISSISGNINSPVFFAQASVLEMMRRMFVFDERMVEIIPYLVYENLGMGKLSALAKSIGARPILLYRMKPFRHEPLATSALAKSDFRNLMRKIEAPKPQAGSPEEAEYNLKIKRTTDLIEGQVRASEASFSKITWRLDKTVRIPTDWIVDISLAFDDSSRANIFAVNFLDNPANAILAAPAIGLPILNEEGVLHHGARPFIPDWPAVITAKESWQKEKPAVPPPIAGYLRAIAAQAAQWYIHSHRLFSGRIHLSPPDAHVWTPNQSIAYSPRGERALRITAGDLISFQFPESSHRYIAYVTKVAHSWSAAPSGAISLRASIDFEMAGPATWASEGKTKFPLEGSTASATIQPSGTTGSSGVRRRPIRRTQGVMESGEFIYANEQRIPFPGVVYQLPFRQDTVPAWMMANRVTSGTFSAPANNSGIPVTSVVVHTHDGSHRATAVTLSQFFQKKMVAGTPLSVHFMIEPQGRLYQYLDCALTAWHAEWANSFSIGVELIIPFSFYRPASQYKSKFPDEFPWPVLSELGAPENEEWRIYSSANSDASRAIRDFFGPTPAQQDTLAKLLATLHRGAGISLDHQKGTSWKNGFARLGRSFLRTRCEIQGAAGLVLHHAQLSANRIDALGVPLDAVTARARELL